MSLSHAEILANYAVVSYRTACTILGGDDEPISESALYKLIRRGVLVVPHRGKVTTASLRAYLEAPGGQSDDVTRAPAAGARAGASTAPPALPVTPAGRVLKLSPRRPSGSEKRQA